MSALKRPLLARVRHRIRPRRPRLGVRGVAVCVAALAILAGVFLWLRQSSLVAVQTVTITGVSGPDAAQIREALTASAERMTTLSVDHGRLRAAVADYPFVRSLHVSTEIPHGMRIAVSEQVPVAILAAGSQRTAVAGDGTVLRHGTGAALPTISVAVPPGAARVTGVTRDEVSLLAAAPYALLAKVASVGRVAGHGLTAVLRDGPALYFGDASRPGAKWSAAVATLADPSSAGASYIDVSDPGRPAAGSGSDSSTASASTTVPAQSSATTGATTPTSTSTTG